MPSQHCRSGASHHKAKHRHGARQSTFPYGRVSVRPSFFFAVNVIASLVYTAPSLRWNPFIRTDGVLSLTHSLYCERMLSGCPLRAVCKLVPQSLVTPVGILISQIRLTLAKQYHTFDPLAPFVVAFTCGVSKCQVPRDCCVSPSPEGDHYVTANNLQQQSAFSHASFPLFARSCYGVL